MKGVLPTIKFQTYFQLHLIDFKGEVGWWSCEMIFPPYLKLTVISNSLFDETAHCLFVCDYDYKQKLTTY